MPIPEPTKNETEKEFIQRCMSDEKMNEDYKDKDQRYAVCQAQLKGRK